MRRFDGVGYTPIDVVFSSANLFCTGPRHDKARHNVGIEYELLLEETLQSMGKSNPKESLAHPSPLPNPYCLLDWTIGETNALQK